MAKLRKSATLETAFGTYIVDEQIGSGGAGTVYGGKDSGGQAVAVKVLSKEAASTDKRKRFKNEIAFLLRCPHPNVVQFLDSGFSEAAGLAGPFYVMRRYDSSLRDVVKAGIPPEQVLPLFLKMLDGVEAAHLLGAIHRDLKPENFLWSAGTKSPAVADFGVASLGRDLAATVVETKPGARLANFAYAAPEQRVVGRQITTAADIYALGLMLNEMFTREIAHGQGYKVIGSSAPPFGYLDPLVAAMLAQAPADRPASIAEVKARIALLGAQEENRQKISKIDGTVIPAGEIDNPLAHEPPQLVHAEWRDGEVFLELDRPLNADWISALQNHLGSFEFMVHPSSFAFSERQARTTAPSHLAQNIVDLFKRWLPKATMVLNSMLQQQYAREKAEREAQLRRARRREEERLRTNRTLQI